MANLHILKELFSKDFPHAILADSPHFSSFWGFYRQACEGILKTGVLQNHYDIIELIKDVRSGQTRTEVLQELKRRAEVSRALTYSESVDACIDFAARLTTMCR